MLAVLGEPGPYLLTGRLLRRAGRPGRRGTASRPGRWTGPGRRHLPRSNPTAAWNGENGIVDTDTIASTLGDGPDLGDRPVIVLARGKPDKGAPEDWEATWSDLQLQAQPPSLTTATRGGRPL